MGVPLRPGAETRAAMAVEACLLPRLRPLLPVAVPDFRWVVGSPPVLVGYEALPGAPLESRALESLAAGERAPVASTLAAFLTALHTAPVEQAAACGAVRSVPERPRGLDEVLDAQETAWVDELFARAEALASGAPGTIVHHDLSSDHILVREGRLTGIIDFTDICVSDPARDFTWRKEYGGWFFRAVLERYVRDDPTLPERAFAYADLEPVWRIGYGVHTGSRAEVEVGRRELRVRALPAGG